MPIDGTIATVTDDLQAPWGEVERRLRALGAGPASSLTEDQRRWYAELLDANELGFAVEMLADWLSDAEAPLRDADRTEILDIAAPVFGRGTIGIQRWDAPLVELPDAHAVAAYARSHHLPADAVERVTAPVTLTKRGVLVTVTRP